LLKTRLRRRTFAIILLLVLLLALLIPITLVEAFPRSGPISTYPASWTDVCNLPVHGDITTDNQIPSQIGSGFTEYLPPGVANFSLSQVYSKIVNSPSFKAISFGHGWVTTYWGLQQESGRNFSYMYVVGQFVIVSAFQPSGYVRAYYNLETGGVTVNYESGLSASCPAE